MNSSTIKSAFILTLALAAPMAILGKTTEETVIRPNTHISSYKSRIIERHLFGHPWGQETPDKVLGKKRIIYLYDSRYPYSAHATHNLSPEEEEEEEEALYAMHGIVVSRIDCWVESFDSLKKRQSSPSKYPSKRAYAWKEFSLLTSTNKKIDIYVSSFETIRWFCTPHTGRMAILIDETGTIVQILGNVRNETEILKAFGLA